METQNKIIVRIEQDTWMATHKGPHAARVFELFGTITLPTPFTSLTPFDVVRERLEYLNPGVRVSRAGVDNVHPVPRGWETASA